MALRAGIAWGWNEPTDGSTSTRQDSTQVTAISQQLNGHSLLECEETVLIPKPGGVALNGSEDRNNARRVVRWYLSEGRDYFVNPALRVYHQRGLMFPEGD